MMQRGPYQVADWEPGEGDRRTRLPYGATLRHVLQPVINLAVSDMANYLSFHLAEGRFGGKQLLSPFTWRALCRPRVDLSGSSPLPKEISNYHYGLGLFGYTYRGERAIAHGGGWYGWGNFMLMLPERRFRHRHQDQSPAGLPSAFKRSSFMPWPIVSWAWNRSPGSIV